MAKASRQEETQSAPSLPPAEPVAAGTGVPVPTQQSASMSPERKMQTTITIAIAASVVLFFAGLGLGYLLGKQSDDSTTTRPGLQQNLQNGNSQFPNFRDQFNSDDNSSSSGSSSSTNTQEN